MRLRVRTPDGELTFGSKYELSKAYAQGLVDPGDEVLEEGASRWRKAAELPELAHLRAKPRGVPRQTLAMLAMVVLSIASLVLLFREDNASRGIGFLLAFGVAYLLMGSTRKAFRRAS